ncbi:LacI family DNA-binding transcriptional regulator [Pseudonocardia sp. DLS-67]
MDGDGPAGAHERVGVRDVAMHAGVAISTVSRVLSDHPNVSSRTRERVLASVADLGYEPNALGQMLRSGATRTVGFAISDISNPLFAEIALGAESVLGQHGYSLVLTNSMGNADRELRNLKALGQRRVDGLLLSVTTESGAELLETLGRFDGPLVTIDRDLRGLRPHGSVVSDHRTGMRAAMTALHDAGHRHAALVGGLATLRPGRQRVNAVRRAARSLGMRCTLRVADGFAGPHAEDVASLLRQPDRPTALIVGNNQVLGVVLEALESEGLKCPADVSLVTCDEVPLLRYFQPRIATVRRDPRQLGEASARMLVDHLAGGADALRKVELPTVFEPGESIGALVS